MAETKYGKYIMITTPENPIHPRVRFGTPLYNVLYVNKELNGAQPGAFFLECQFVTQPSPDRRIVPPHNHDFDEYLVFLGTNPKDPTDLGGEVEFWLGDEGEKHIITKSCAVFLPKGFYHCPLWYNKVDTPIILVVIANTLDYSHLSFSTSPQWAEYKLPGPPPENAPK